MKDDKVIRAIYPIFIKQTKISIQQQLKFFIYSQLVKLKKIKDVDFIYLEKFIPVNRLNYTLISYPYLITYRCTVAFELASRSSYPAIVIAEEIFELIKQTCSCLLMENEQITIEHYSDIPCIGFILKLIEPGWLEFTLDDKYLFLWLQNQDISQLLTHCTTYDSKSYDSLYIVQYAYLRCCHLIHLAKEQGITAKLNVKSLNNEKALNKERYIFSYDMEFEELLLNSHTERQLISQIFMMLDSEMHKCKEDNTKQILILSYCLLEFERSCRIFSSKELESMKKLQARLNLIIITQSLLQKVYFNRV